MISVHGMKGFFSAPVFPGDADKTIAASMVHYGITFGLVAIVLNVPALILAGDPPVRILASTTVLILALLTNRYLLGRGFVYGAGALFLSLAWVALAAVNYTAGGVRAPGYALHIVLIICVGFIFGGRWAFLPAALSTALGVCFALLESRGLLPPPQVHNVSDRYLFIIAADFFIIAAILTIMVNQLRIAIAEGRKELLVRQEAERELARHEAVLEQTVRERTAQLLVANSDLESFSYSISHDLRAPLRSIKGFTEILIDSYGPQLDEEKRRLLSNIDASAIRMDALVNDLLAFSKLGREDVQRRQVKTVEIVAEILTELRSEAGDRAVEVVVGDLPACSADKAMLRQVFTNLLANAFKYTRRQRETRIEVGCTRTGNESVYFVRDNGAGFDMSRADKLFGVFQRLHRMEDFEGTGVGLALVKRIVEKHGGRIWAQAAPDAGATFSFTIEPLATPGLETSPPDRAVHERRSASPTSP